MSLETAQHAGVPLIVRGIITSFFCMPTIMLTMMICAYYLSSRVPFVSLSKSLYVGFSMRLDKF
jgi:hypothetical protein